MYVARALEGAASINAQLSLGYHVVLSPGVYRLQQPLRLAVAGQVLLGMGLATLVATAGDAHATPRPSP